MALPPLIFDPYLRPQIWGGRRLLRWNKQLPSDGDYGESWELSAHALHVSKVDAADGKERSLDDLIAQHGQELLGKSYGKQGFPLLVKLLDCHRLLSVQVHPTDELAAAIIGEEAGKTEAWVVLSADSTAKIYAGLKAGVGPRELEHAIAAGTVEQCLHAFSPTVGDCIFIPAGTVHAMGGGIVIAEFQQTSDATFRLFDWNRVGSDGKHRQLHIAESMKCIDWSAGPVAPVKPKLISGLPSDVHGEALVDCPYFQLERYTFRCEWTQFFSSWCVAMVIRGQVELETPGLPQRIKLQAGQTVLIPASLKKCHWFSDAESTILIATA